MWYFAFAFSDCQKPYVLEGWYQLRRLQHQQLNNSQHLQGVLSSSSAGLLAGSCSRDAMQSSLNWCQAHARNHTLRQGVEKLAVPCIGPRLLPHKMLLPSSRRQPHTTTGC